MRGIPLDRPSRGNLVAVVARFLFDPSENRGYCGMKPTQNIGMKESVWERQRSEVGLDRNPETRDALRRGSRSPATISVEIGG